MSGGDHRAGAEPAPAGPRFPSQLRRSALSQRWTLIAPGRAKRPDGFQAGAARDPFDPAAIPRSAVTDVIEDGRGGWQAIAIRNAFPVVAPGDAPDRRGRVVDGFGHHEVIVHSPDPHRSFESFARREALAVLELYRRRIAALSARPGVRYVVVFTNRGREAGASVVHPHSQVVGLPIVPPNVQRLVGGAAAASARDRPLVDDEWAHERGRAPRIVEREGEWEAYCPFAPRSNFHVRIQPPARSDFVTLDAHRLDQLADLLCRTHRRLNAVAGVAPYNMFLRLAPVDGAPPGFRWHVDLVPRLSTPGGLELATELDVVTVAPEDAAAQLRAARV